MTDHAEEQEMEAEALAAIFDTHFTILDNDDDDDDSKKNREWTIDLYPEHASDEDELQLLNHVAIQMKIELPKQYPSAEDDDDDDHLPKLQIMILKGLANDPHGLELQALAQEEARNNRGLPSIYAIAERLREWLVEHNRPGLDDTSAYATMMRKQEQEQKKKFFFLDNTRPNLWRIKKAAAAMASTQYESQMAGDVMTVAEKEELAVHKRRSEGTPCNKESFEAWRERFDAEMAAQQNGENQTTGGTNGGDGDIITTTSTSSKKNSKATVTTTTSHRMTGYEYFSSKSTNLEALEAAAEQAEEEEEEDDDDEVGENTPNHVNEELFDDDVDLDDLDFDDDEDDDDELDI